jgi:hypothetical protein
LKRTSPAACCGKEPRATLEEVRMGRKKMYASSARAQQELGFRVAPVYPAMRAAIEWFRAHGYAPHHDYDSQSRARFSSPLLPREIASLVSKGGWHADSKLLVRNIHLFRMRRHRRLRRHGRSSRLAGG